MTVVGMAPRFEMGRVAKLTFGSIGRNWVVFGLLGLLLSAIPQALTSWFQARMFAAPVPGTFPTGASFLGSSVASLINFAGVMILQAALVHGVISDLNGRKATFGECLQTGIRFALPIIAILILSALGIGLGLVLLIVPGVMLYLAWMVAVPAEVVERTGVFGAFSRSAELTRNHRWSLLGLYVIFLILTWILLGTLLALTGGFRAAALMMGTRTPVMMVVLAVVQVIQGVIGSAGIAAIYYELRSIKEGIGPESLASVFD